MPVYNMSVPDFQMISMPIFINSLIKAMPDRFIPGANISVVYGSFNGMLWEGGRSIITKEKDSADIIEKTITKINENGMGARLTATNSLLTREHIRDEYCNTILKIMSESGSTHQNGVSIASPVLEDYILEKYPNLYIDRSVTTLVHDTDTIKKLLDSENYKFLVPYPNVYFQEEFLELDQKYKNHIEILCNSCINPNINVCRAHYDAISRACLKHERFTEWVCDYVKGDDIVSTLNGTPEIRRNTIKAIDIIKTYIPAGFSNFKLSGRREKPVTISKHILQYMLDIENNSDEEIESFAEELAIMYCKTAGYDTEVCDGYLPKY